MAPIEPSYVTGADGWHYVSVGSGTYVLKSEAQTARTEAQVAKAENERLREQLRYALDALDGAPWTGWTTHDGRVVLDG